MKWLEWLLAPWLRTPKQVSDLWEFVLDESEVVTAALNRNEDRMSEIDIKADSSDADRKIAQVRKELLALDVVEAVESKSWSYDEGGPTPAA